MHFTPRTFFGEVSLELSVSNFYFTPLYAIAAIIFLLAKINTMSTGNSIIMLPAMMVGQCICPSKLFRPSMATGSVLYSSLIVIMSGQKYEFHEPITCKNRMVATVDFAIGSIIFVMIWNSFASSSFADSINSSGICMKFCLNMKILNTLTIHGTICGIKEFNMFAFANILNTVMKVRQVGAINAIIIKLKRKSFPLNLYLANAYAAGIVVSMVPSVVQTSTIKEFFKYFPIYISSKIFMYELKVNSCGYMVGGYKIDSENVLNDVIIIQ